MFEDCHVHADTEATGGVQPQGCIDTPASLACLTHSLACLQCWAHLHSGRKKNIAAEPLAPEERQRIAAVCSRIRFPDVPPDVLINYWTAFQWLQQYDPGKELLLRAVSGDYTARHLYLQHAL